MIPNAFANEVIVQNAPDSHKQGCEKNYISLPELYPNYVYKCFDPNPVRINVNDIVTWENTVYWNPKMVKQEDGTWVTTTHNGVSHTVTSGNPTTGPDGYFDSGVMLGGDSYSKTFTSYGTYDYFCKIHPWMKGTIIVEAGSSTPSQTPSQTQSTTYGSQTDISDSDLQKKLDEYWLATSEFCDDGTVWKDGKCQKYVPPQQPQGGGCLIATAAFGSEMAPQVQFLREIRDNTVLQTESGSAFMTGFNQFYYSFSPTVADYERENHTFKEAVKITLTPLLTSLTLLQYADIDSESEMLGYGIGVILLNIGMYFVAPAILIMKIKERESRSV